MSVPPRLAGCRLFSGLIELRFAHVVDIAGALGLQLEEVMFFAYPPSNRPPSQAAERLRKFASTTRALGSPPSRQ